MDESLKMKLRLRANFAYSSSIYQLRKPTNKHSEVNDVNRVKAQTVFILCGIVDMRNDGLQFIFQVSTWLIIALFVHLLAC